MSCMKSNDPSMKLIYFDLRARGETARLLFQLGNKQFVDERLSFEQWPTKRAEMPFKALPVLEVNGKQVAESGAVFRYIAKICGLAGRSPWETALADMYGSAACALIDHLEPCIKEKDEGKKAEMMTNYKENILPGILANFEAILAQSTGDYLVGNKLTWADVHLVVMTDFPANMMGEVLENYPKVVALRKRVCAIPKIAKWIETRPPADI